MKLTVTLESAERMTVNHKNTRRYSDNNVCNPPYNGLEWIRNHVVFQRPVAVGIQHFSDLLPYTGACEICMRKGAA